MRLKGKVAPWFYGVIILVAAVEVPIFIISAWVTPDLLSAVISLLVLIGVEAFCLPVAFRNYVEFQPDALLVVFGWLKKRISYDELVGISATKAPWSSLAASLDRIQIKTKSRGKLMISVADKARFFSQMQSRKPDIELEFPQKS